MRGISNYDNYCVVSKNHRKARVDQAELREEKHRRTILGCSIFLLAAILLVVVHGLLV